MVIPAEPVSPVLKRIHQAALRLFAETGATQVSVSELAQAAGVARGTIYNNLPAPEALFQVIASELGEEMHQRVLASFAPADSPPQRLANGVRFFIRRTHEEPDWGRFLCRFAFSSESMHITINSPLAQEIVAGTQAGYAVGKLYPTRVDFRAYRFEHEDFVGPNFVAVRQSHERLKNLLAGK